MWFGSARVTVALDMTSELVVPVDVSPGKFMGSTQGEVLSHSTSYSKEKKIALSAEYFPSLRI
jgi:hypothetical protein